MGSPCICTQKDTLLKLRFFTDSPASTLCKISRYLSNDHGPSNTTFSKLSIFSNWNKALFSPKSHTSKFRYCFQFVSRTHATDSRFILLLVWNLLARINPAFCINGAMSILLDSLSDNFSPAHMFVISSIVSSQSNTEATFYRLSGERCLPCGKKVFTTSVHEGNLERKRFHMKAHLSHPRDS